MKHILASSVVSCNRITRAVENIEVTGGKYRGHLRRFQHKCDWGHTRSLPLGVCYADADGEKIMTLIAHVDHLLPRTSTTLDRKYRKESDGLFAVTMWSVVGMALTALTIWLGLGGQIEPLIGLG